MFSRERWYGMPVRRLGTLYNSHVQRMEFLAAPGEAKYFHQALWRHVKKLRRRWDVLQLAQFERDAAATRDLENEARETSMRTGYWTEGASPHLPIEGTWEAYFASLSANRRGDLRRKMRKLEEAGTVSLQTVRGEPGLLQAFEEGLRIEAMAWKGDSGTAMLSDARITGFYRDLAARMAA